MKKIIISLITILLMLGMVFAAKPNFVEKVNPAGKIVSIPEHATEVAPGVFYLGKALDNGRVVEGYAIFVRPVCGDGTCHPSENSVTCPEDCGEPEPPVCGDGECNGEETCETCEEDCGECPPDPFCGDGTCNGDETPETCPEDCEVPDPDTSSCYTFLASGAKWKTVEPYIVNPANTRELDGAFVAGNLAVDIVKWEAAANFNILGAGSVTSETLVADTVSPDGKNEVLFADIGSPGAIGVTIIWGVFGGPTRRRQLVEWDMVFDDVDFDWGIGEANKMDFENIATHELGHAVGMGDLYNSECSEQTMYGYASNGETNKRSLEDGDIAGINNLY